MAGRTPTRGYATTENNSAYVVLNGPRSVHAGRCPGLLIKALRRYGNEWQQRNVCGKRTFPVHHPHHETGPESGAKIHRRQREHRHRSLRNGGLWRGTGVYPDALGSVSPQDAASPRVVSRTMELFGPAQLRTTSSACQYTVLRRPWRLGTNNQRPRLTGCADRQPFRGRRHAIGWCPF